MAKVFSTICLTLAVALLAAPAAHADTAPTGQQIAKQERARVLHAPESIGERILQQERGRQNDSALVGPGSPAPVQLVTRDGGFDYGDAGVGAALALGLALLGAAAVTVRGSRSRTEAGRALSSN